MTHTPTNPVMKQSRGEKEIKMNDPSTRAKDMKSMCDASQK